MNWEKDVFNSEKKEFSFKPIGNSTHTTEFLTLRKFDLLMFYPTDNESTSSTSLNKYNNDFMVNKEGAKFM